MKDIQRTIIIPASEVSIIKPLLLKVFKDSVADMFIVPLYDKDGVITHYISSGMMSSDIVDSFEKLNSLCDAGLLAKVFDEKDRSTINSSVATLKTDSKDPYEFMSIQKLDIVNIKDVIDQTIVTISEV